MKLLNNGQMGIYIDSEYVDTLKTPEMIEDELDNVALGNFEPVVRDNDTVVDPVDYIAYLKSRKEQLNELISKHELDIIEKETNIDNLQTPIAPVTPIKLVAANESEVDELTAKLKHSAKIIKNLMLYTKDVKLDTKSDIKPDIKPDDEVVYTGDLDMTASASNASIKGVFGDVVREMSSGNKVSKFTNVAVARGLLGDERARAVIDELYTEGTFDEFITRLGEVTIDFSKTSIDEP